MAARFSEEYCTSMADLIQDAKTKMLEGSNLKDVHYMDLADASKAVYDEGDDKNFGSVGLGLPDMLHAMNTKGMPAACYVIANNYKNEGNYLSAIKLFGCGKNTLRKIRPKEHHTYASLQLMMRGFYEISMILAQELPKGVSGYGMYYNYVLQFEETEPFANQVDAVYTICALFVSAVKLNAENRYTEAADKLAKLLSLKDRAAETDYMAILFRCSSLNYEFLKDHVVEVGHASGSLLLKMKHLELAASNAVLASSSVELLLPAYAMSSIPAQKTCGFCGKKYAVDMPRRSTGSHAYYCSRDHQQKH